MTDTAGGKKNTGMAIVAYFIFFIPLLTDAKNDTFVKYHVKQSLVLVIASIIGSFIPFVNLIVWLPILIFWIMGIMNAAAGKMTPVPLIGQFAEKLNF